MRCAPPRAYGGGVPRFSFSFFLPHTAKPPQSRQAGYPPENQTGFSQSSSGSKCDDGGLGGTNRSTLPRICETSLSILANLSLKRFVTSSMSRRMVCPKRPKPSIPPEMLHSNSASHTKPPIRIQSCVLMLPEVSTQRRKSKRSAPAPRDRERSEQGGKVGDGLAGGLAGGCTRLRAVRCPWLGVVRCEMQCGSRVPRLVSVLVSVAIVQRCVSVRGSAL
jgi:hypothetical protein